LYDELFEAWKKERESSEIQPLPKDFYGRIAEYIKKIREERRMLDEKTVRGRLIQKEEENAKKMVEELIWARYEKMVAVAAGGGTVPTSTLTEEEENLYRKTASQTESFHAFIRNLLQGRLGREGNREAEKVVVVRILREIPEIVGVDMKVYGPFKPEDIATLPKENANILIKQGAAAEVEVPKN